MALSDLLTNPLDTRQADAQEFMRRVQGNVLKGHARAHTAHVFMTFTTEGAEKAREWIAGPLSKRLTSAADQEQQTLQWKATHEPVQPFFAFFMLRLITSRLTATRQHAAV